MRSVPLIALSVPSQYNRIVTKNNLKLLLLVVPEQTISQPHSLDYSVLELDKYNWLLRFGLIIYVNFLEICRMLRLVVLFLVIFLLLWSPSITDDDDFLFNVEDTT